MPDLTDRIDLPAETLARLAAYFRACHVPNVKGALEDAAAIQLELETLVWKEASTLAEIADTLASGGRSDRDRRVLVQRAGETASRLAALVGG